MAVLEKVTGSSLYREFDRLFGASMLDKGYIRVLNYAKCPNYLKRLTDDGLFATVKNSTSKDYTGGVFVNMHIGVAYDAAEKMLCELTNETRVKQIKYKGPISTQYSINRVIKDRNYEKYEMNLKSQIDVLPAVNNMLGFVDEIAEPFFSNFKDVEDYLEYRKDIALHSVDRDRIVPIIYYLMGEKIDAIDYITSRLNDRTRAGYSDITDKVFLKNFFNLIQSIDSPQ